MSCGSQCDNNAGFVYDATWLNDVSTGGGPYWIEAGYTTYTPYSTTYYDYFWADHRPGDKQVNQHYLGSFLGDVGYYTEFYIDRVSPSSFDVDVYGHSYTDQEISGFNSMVPNDINIGEELQGSGGASSGTAYFTYNEWIDVNDYPHYQTAMGSLKYLGEAPPPYRGWNVTPQQNSTGGSLYTYCC